MSSLRLLLISMSLVGLISSCSSDSERAPATVSVSSLYAAHDTIGLREAAYSQRTSLNALLTHSLHEYLVAKSRGDTAQSESLDSLLAWAIPIYTATTGFSDLSTKYGIYRPKNGDWCTQKLRLDVDYAGLKAQFIRLSELNQPVKDEWDSLKCALIFVCNQAGEVGDPERLGLGLQMLGKIHSDLFMDYVTAERLFEQSIKYLQQFSGQDAVIYALIGQGQALLQLGQTGRAKKCFAAADSIAALLELLEPRGHCSYYLAETYYGNRELDSALATAQRSTKIRESLGDSSSLAYSLSCEGLVREALGDLDKAEHIYSRAQRLFEFSADHRGSMLNLLRRSSLRMRSGQVMLAKALLDSIRVQDFDNDPELHLFANYGSALCFYKLGQTDSARCLLEVCLKEIERAREKTEATSMLVGFLSDKIDMYDLLTQIQIDRYQRTAARDDLDSVLCAMERGRAQSLREMIDKSSAGDREHLVSSHSPPGCILRLPPDSVAHSLDTKVRVGLSNRAEDLEVGHATHREGSGRKPEFEQVSLSTCQQHLLTDRETILEYNLGSFGCYVLAISNQAVSLNKLPVSLDSLDILISEAYAQLRTRPADTLATATLRTANALLYRLLLPPSVRASLNAGTLRIIGDRRLTTFPFAALVDEVGKFLCESCTVVYSPSLAIAAKTRHLNLQRQHREGIVIIGDSSIPVEPRFSEGSGLPDTENRSRSAASLPYSEKEIGAIAALFGHGGATIIAGKLANRDYVKAMDLTGKRYLHIAAHGVVDETDPLNSAIILSQDTDGDAGRLSVSDILDLDLSTDMAFLSACGTGTGEVLAGEGVVCLAKSFLAAGSETVLATLWDVDDRSTSQFVIDFYKRLKERQTVEAALTNSQRAMLVSDIAIYRHPYYWAPFVLLSTALR